jgi:RNA polymerase sigma factor (sigma-70 family)
MRSLFDSGAASGATDAQLLERIKTGAEAALTAEAAFAALVARHGPMVLGVCRRALRDPRDVEDAFQATFLVLTRKAASVRVDDSLGRWLYGVARRVAVRARKGAERRRSREGHSTGGDPESPKPDWEHVELLAAVDEELTRLPEKYRSPVILCYLEGLSHTEAAQRLRWPLGTVKGRLAQAREILRARLTRRGFAPSATLAVLTFEANSRAAVAPAVAQRVAQAATQRLVEGTSAAAFASAAVTALTREVLKDMMLIKLRTTAAGVLAAIAVFAGVAGLALFERRAQANAAPGQTQKRVEQTTADAKSAAGQPDSGFRDGWKKTVPIADSQLGKGDQYVVWVEDGWLQVRRETASGAADWHFVLARASDPTPPALGVPKGSVRFEVSYRGGRYFVREDIDVLQCLRERKANDQPWPSISTAPDTTAIAAASDETAIAGSGGSVDAPPVLMGWRSDGFFRLASSPDGKKFDAFVRLCPLNKKNEGGKKGHGFSAQKFIKQAFYDDYRSQDDGELLVAHRQLEASVLPELEVGDAAPAFAAMSLDGKPINLADYRGKYVLLDFWATWCGPCVAEMPHLQEVHESFRQDKRFAMIGISLDDDTDAAKKFVEEKKLPWVQLVVEKDAEKPININYGVSGIPASFLIGPDGTVVATGMRGAKIKDAVARALAGP